MVNYHDPAVIEADLLAVNKLWHATAGLYIWEFFTTLDYEWNIIQRRFPFRWPTFLIYSVTRLATLISIVFALVNMNAKGHYNCEAMTVFTLTVGYMAFAGGSLLIVFRIIAIWNKRKSIIAIAAIIWGTNVAFLIQGTARIRSTFIEAQDICVVTNIDSAKLNIIITLVTDILLLVIMLVGLLRLRCNEHGAYSMGRLLWRQGLIWLLIVTVFEVPSVVLISLNLNAPLDYLFWLSQLIAMSIAGTRIHRSLVDFAYDNTEVYDRDTFTSAPAHSGRRSRGSSHPNGSKTLSDGDTASKANSSGSSPNGTEVSIHMIYEEYQMPPSIHSGSGVSAEAQLGEKPDGLGLDDDVEKIG